MLLEEFKKDSSKRFKRVNRMLGERYGITISPKTSQRKLEQARDEVFETVQQLKINGSVSRTCPELSKNLLILECVESLIENKRLDELRQDFSSSGPYRRVIEWLSDFVAQNLELGDDIEDACDQAMKEYRSSKWRFPDEAVRFDCRAKAIEKLGMKEAAFESVDCDTEEEVDESAWDDLLDKSGRAKMVPQGQSKADSYLDGSTLSLSPDENDGGYETMQGQNAYNRQQIARSKQTPKRKTEMREDFVRQLRALLESEVDEAEIIIAVKGIGKTIQDMIEKIGRLQNEDLPPLSDQVRDTYGPNIASNFQTSTNTALQTVMDSLYQSKDEVDATVTKMASGAGDLAADVDMDTEIAGDELDAELGGDLDAELGGDLGAELGDAEIDLDIDDEFGGDIAASGPEEEPLGRAKKESAQNMKKKIAEMQKLLASAKALKETA